MVIEGIYWRLLIISWVSLESSSEELNSGGLGVYGFLHLRI